MIKTPVVNSQREFLFFIIWKLIFYKKVFAVFLRKFFGKGCRGKPFFQKRFSPALSSSHSTPAWTRGGGDFYLTCGIRMATYPSAYKTRG